MDNISAVWPNWKTESFIGQGAFGKVYKVKREINGVAAYAAVKVIEMPQDRSEIKELEFTGMDEASIRNYFEDMVNSLVSEIQIMESLKSANNVVSIEDFEIRKHENEIGWTVYIRMELLQSLNQYMSQKGSLTIREIIHIGIDVCAALEACETYHVIHRDIKPDNVFRNEYGSFKIGDFGISKQLEHTKSAVSQKGTSMYMAPEIYRGEGYTKNVDLYALGIMLYKLLNGGRYPFMPFAPNPLHPSDIETAMTRRLSGEIVPKIPGINSDLMKIVQKACACKAAERFQSASDLKHSLEQWLIIQTTDRKPKEQTVKAETENAKQKSGPGQQAEDEEKTTGFYSDSKTESTISGFGQSWQAASDQRAHFKSEEQGKPPKQEKTPKREKQPKQTKQVNQTKQPKQPKPVRETKASAATKKAAAAPGEFNPQEWKVATALMIAFYGLMVVGIIMMCVGGPLVPFFVLALLALAYSGYLFKGIAAKLPMPNGGKGFRIQCWILIITGYGTALFGAMEYMGPLAAVVAAAGAPAGIVCSVLLIYSLFAVGNAHAKIHRVLKSMNGNTGNPASSGSKNQNPAASSNKNQNSDLGKQNPNWRSDIHEPKIEIIRKNVAGESQSYPYNEYRMQYITELDAAQGATKILYLNRGGVEIKVQVKIPAKIIDGNTIRVPGYGKLNPVTGTYGDLYLTIVIQK